jgi:hypothetical protein
MNTDLLNNVMNMVNEQEDVEAPEAPDERSHISKLNKVWYTAHLDASTIIKRVVNTLGVQKANELVELYPGMRTMLEDRYPTLLKNRQVEKDAD